MSDNFHEEEVLGKAYDSQLMKRLLAYLQPYKWNVAMALVVLLLASAVQLAGPFLYKIGIDDYIEKNDPSGLNLICLIFFIVLVIEFIVQFAQIYLIQWIGQKVMYDIRRNVFSHIQRLPVTFFDKNPVGRVVTRVTSDVQSLHEMLSSGVVAIFGDIFKLIGIVVVLLAASER